MLIHNKDDIEFVTEFPCFLGHPIDKNSRATSYLLEITQPRAWVHITCVSASPLVF